MLKCFVVYVGLEDLGYSIIIPGMFIFGSKDGAIYRDATIGI